jgi:hypothetical protein
MIEKSNNTREIQIIFNNNKAMEMALMILSSSRTLEHTFLKSLLMFCNSMLLK